MNENVIDKLVHAAARAYRELNEIRARDVVPWTRYGKSDVDEAYFSSVVDALDAAVRDATGLPAHCHPCLYKNRCDAKEAQ